MKIPVNVSDRSGEEIQERAMERLFNGSELPSLQRAEGTPWGSPKDWYLSSAKFMCSFATVNVEEWLALHDAIGHSRNGAYSGTVEKVETDINEGHESSIPTPPLEVKPQSFGFGEETKIYEPVREGRSRAVGAQNAGLDTIPLLVAVRRPRR